MIVHLSPVPPTYDEAVTYEDEEVFIKAPSSSDDLDFKHGHFDQSCATGSHSHSHSDFEETDEENEEDGDGDEEGLEEGQDKFVPNYIAFSWLIPSYAGNLKRESFRIK